MATQICPNCKQNSFTWYIDEEESLLTQWICIDDCTYRAFEDESRERKCQACGNTTESYMVDNEKEYWWCSSCNRIEVIKTISKDGGKT